MMQMSESEKKTAMKRAAGILRDKRIESKITGASIGKAIGVSGSAILSLERGDGKPSNALCEALEKYWDLPPLTIPRLATRQNHRIGRYIATTSTPPPQAPPPQPTEDPAVRALESQIAALEKMELPPFAAMLVRLSEIQSAMAALNVERVEITLRGIQVVQK